MAYALVGSLGTVASGTTSVTPSFGQATTAGNLLIAWAVDESILGSNPFSISGTGWSTAISSGSPSQEFVAIFYKPNCGASESAPTISGTSGDPIDAALGEFSGGATSSPVDSTAGPNSPATAAGVDAAAGELIISIGASTQSKAGTTTTSLTLNNGATASGNLNNDASSTLAHYRMVYGITTGNSSADSATYSDTSMNLSTLTVALASFKLFTAAAATPARPVPVHLPFMT